MHGNGNSEGLVTSNNSQGDAGLTTGVDSPELINGAHGNQPNERCHTLKVFGSSVNRENFILGINNSLQSGRPINAFGVALASPDRRVDYCFTHYLSDDSGAASDSGAIIYDYEQVTRSSRGVPYGCHASTRTGHTE
ncbi:MAG: hypothetical protein GYB58_19385 [Gammaproteobacteria bacterium]|nr:hypothetical protein [Gammaproteobacteria bacterium]